MLRWYRSTVRNLGGYILGIQYDILSSVILARTKRNWSLIRSSTITNPCSRDKTGTKHFFRGECGDSSRKRRLAADLPTYTALSPTIKSSSVLTPKGLPTSTPPLTDDVHSVQAISLNTNRRMEHSHGRATFQRAVITETRESPRIQDSHIQVSPKSCNILVSNSNEVFRESSKKRDAVDILSDFLLPRNMKSATPQTYSANALRSLYHSAKTRCQLHRLSSNQMTALLSLFGSLSLAPPRPHCIYINKFVSQMDKSSHRTFWPFVLGIGRDKVELGKPLHGIDRYWIMRAHLANIDVIKNESPRKSNARMHSISQATEQYFRIFRHTIDPEVHLPYLQAMLSLGKPDLASDVVHRLCIVLDAHRNPHPRLLQFFWDVVLKYGHGLSTSSKEKLLATIHNRLSNHGMPDLRRQRRLGSSNELVLLRPIADVYKSFQPSLSTHQLAVTLGATIFPLLAVTVPVLVHRWAISLATAVFAPTNSVEARWNSLILVAIYNAPTSLPHGQHAAELAGDHLNAGIVAWRTVFVLATLGQNAMNMGPPASAQAHDVKLLVRTLWLAWKNAAKDDRHRTPLMARVILTAFLRVSATTLDAFLKDACHRYCLAHSFWLENEVTKFAKLQIRDLLVQYILASVSCGDAAWPEVFATLTNRNQLRAEIIEALLRYFVPRDINIARQLYLVSERNDIRLSMDVTQIIGCALASFDPSDAVVLCLSKPGLSRNQVQVVLEAILRSLQQHRCECLDKTVAASLGNVMQRLYAETAPSKSLKYPIRYIIPVLASSGHWSAAATLVESIHRSTPSFFTMPFFLRFMRMLVRHQQPRYAISLLRLLGHLPPRSVDNFRRQLTQSLAQSGASSLAKRVYRTKSGHDVRGSTREVLTRAVDFRLRSPMRYLTIRILRILSPSISHGPSVRCAMSILLHARRPAAARKVFEYSNKSLDPSTRTCVGNLILHNSLRRPSLRHGRLVRHVLRTKDFLVTKYGFVPDGVTVNIVLKAILRWRKFIDSPKLKALFNHMIKRSQIASDSCRDGAPFATSLSLQTFHFPDLPPSISFEKHIRPMCKMFIKAFHLRGDAQAAKIVIGILKMEKSAMLRRRELRNRARLHGLSKAKKNERREDIV